MIITIKKSNYIEKERERRQYILLKNRAIFHFIKRTFISSFIQEIVVADCLSTKEYYRPRVAASIAYTKHGRLLNAIAGKTYFASRASVLDLVSRYQEPKI